MASFRITFLFGNSKQRNPGLPDRSEAAASPDDPFAVLEQGNLPP